MTNMATKQCQAAICPVAIGVCAFEGRSLVLHAEDKQGILAVLELCHA